MKKKPDIKMVDYIEKLSEKKQLAFVETYTSYTVEKFSELARSTKYKSVMLALSDKGPYLAERVATNKNMPPSLIKDVFNLTDTEYLVWLLVGKQDKLPYWLQEIDDGGAFDD